ncbi:MAG: hypothetical protein WC456_03615 [Patescibacteria group bacterium]
MSKEENLNKDIDLKNYDDPTGISLRELNFGLWLSENRQKLLKVLTVGLIVLCAFFFIYSSYGLINYFLAGDPNAEITVAVPTSPRQLTVDLEIAPLEIFSHDEQVDLAVKLRNQNDKFMATFKYCFTLAGEDLACGEGFILPASEKYIFALGQRLSGSQSEAAFAITDIFWRRINAHQIPDWNAYLASRLDFSVSELSFSAGAMNSLSDKINLNSLSFSIQNQTAYSYYEVPLNILLYSGAELVGVNRYILQDFLAGAERQIKMVWPDNLGGVNRTEIVPDLNIIDEAAYLKYQGASSE